MIIAAFKTGLALNAAFICLQEPYVGVYAFSHPDYEVKWPKKEKTKKSEFL
jgi:hypothetical protein